MSVNGTGRDRRTSKPLTDSTTWSVKNASGAVLEAEVTSRSKKREVKTLSGLSAAEAFAAVRNFRRQEIFAAAVRS